MDYVTPFDISMLKNNKAVLSSEIAGEGTKVLLSDGSFSEYTPPPEKPVIPDLSHIKSIKHLFGVRPYKVYPAWLYHPTDQPVIVRTDEEAAKYGLGYRDATIEERGKYRVEKLWDWTDDTKWRPEPWPGTLGFDKKRPGTGKTFVPEEIDPITARNALLDAVIPAVTAAVLAGMKGNGPQAPAHVDKSQWEAFLAFQAFQKSAEAIQEIKETIASTPAAVAEEEEIPDNRIPPADERRLWEAEAERKGIKVDGRWSLERLKSEVEKAA
jgi:hypothetical protein